MNRPIIDVQDGLIQYEDYSDEPGMTQAVRNKNSAKFFCEIL
jgi:hypothetical protein